MGRDFDGANDNIAFGSDASLDSFAQKSAALWIELDAVGLMVLMAKDRVTAAWSFFLNGTGGANWLELFHTWTGGGGNWEAQTTSLAAGTLYHVAFTYDSGAAANDPVLYLDGVAQTLTEVDAPVTAPADDAAAGLFIGEQGAGNFDFNGRKQAVCYDNTLWTAADVNRHRWWGCAPGGPSTVKVWHPFWTESLANKGTATADGTATGTTMASLPRVERMLCGATGCGR